MSSNNSLNDSANQSHDFSNFDFSSPFEVVDVVSAFANYVQPVVGLNVYLPLIPARLPMTVISDMDHYNDYFINEVQSFARIIISQEVATWLAQRNIVEFCEQPLEMMNLEILQFLEMDAIPEDVTASVDLVHQFIATMFNPTPPPGPISGFVFHYPRRVSTTAMGERFVPQAGIEIPDTEAALDSLLMRIRSNADSIYDHLTSQLSQMTFSEARDRYPAIYPGYHFDEVFYPELPAPDVDVYLSYYLMGNMSALRRYEDEHAAFNSQEIEIINRELYLINLETIRPYPRSDYYRELFGSHDSDLAIYFDESLILDDEPSPKYDSQLPEYEESEWFWIILFGEYEQDGESNFDLLKMCGDVETNPGWDNKRSTSDSSVPMTTKEVNKMLKKFKELKLEKDAKVQKKQERNLDNKLKKITDYWPVKYTSSTSRRYSDAMAGKPRSRTCDAVDVEEIFTPQGLFEMLGAASIQHNIDESVLETLNRFANSLDRMPSLDQLQNVINSATVEVKFNATEVAFQVVLYFVILISGFNCATNFNKKWLSIFVIASSIALWQSGDAKEFVKTHFNDFCGKVQPDFQPQSFGPETLSSLVKVVLGFIVLKSGLQVDLKNVKSVINFADTTAKMGKAHEGVMAVVNWAQEAIIACVNFIRTDILGLSLVNWVSTTYEDVDKWCNKVIEIMNQAYSGELKVNLTNCDKIQALIIEGTKLTNKFHDSKTLSHVKDAIISHMNLLKKLQNTYMQANVHGAGARTEPLIILMRGKPGVGKSYAAQPLAIDILRRVLPENEIQEMKRSMANYFYSRFSEHQYWDGYAQQPVTFFDDFGQAATMPGNPDDEYMNLIRCAGLFQFVLHMANLEEKGRVVFNSKVIICSTNLFHFCPSSIVDIEALNRRFDIVLDVVPKLEYSNGNGNGNESSPLHRRLNRNHPSLINKEFTTDIYEFHMKDIMTNSTIRIMDWEELVQLCVEKYQANDESGEKYQQFLRSMIEEYLPQADIDVRFNEAEENLLNNLPMMEELPALEKKKISEFEDLQEYFSTFSNLPSKPQRSYKFDLHRSRRIVAMFANELLDVDLLQMEIRNVNPRIYDQAVECGDLTLFRYIESIANSDEAPEILKNTRKQMYGVTEDKLNWLKSIRDKVLEYLKSTKSFLGDMWKKYPMLEFILIVLGAPLVGFFIGKIVSWIIGLFKNDEEFESEGPSGEKGRSKDKGKVHRRREARPHRHGEQYRAEADDCSVTNEYSPEGGVDQNAVEIVNKIVDRSMYMMKYPHSEKKAGVVTVLCGRVAILPYHYVPKTQDLLARNILSGESLIELTNKYAGKDISIKIPVDTILNARQNECLKDLDLCVIELPKNVHQHPNITKFFIEHNILTKKLDLNMRLVVPEDRNVLGYITVAQKRDNVKVAEDDQEWYIRQGLVYRAYTDKGDCGSIVTLIDPSLGSGRIAGVHVAGSTTGNGLASVISREDISDALKLFPEQLPPSQEIFDLVQAFENPAPGNFVPYCKTPKTIYTPPTQLRKSELYECWGPAKTMPAILRPKVVDGIMIDPRANAIARYGKPKQIVDVDLANTCMNHVFSTIINNSNFKDRHAPATFDFETAVLGIPGNDYCNSIPRDTSAGYPYVMNPKPGFSGKTWYFGKDEEYDLTRPACIELKNQIEKLLEQARMGKRMFHVFTDTMKDERRPIAKALQGKTRLVSACPLPLLIATRMFFLDFSMFLMENQIYTGSAVGLNVHGEGWDHLARYLQEKGKKNIAGDYSGFDTSEMAIILSMICDYINMWYSDGNDLIRTVLFVEVYNSIHLSGCTIYQWLACLPSGHPLTTIINTLYNLWSMRMAWAYTHPEGRKGLREFNQHVNMIAYGDDNALNISDECSKYFNQNTISSALAVIGLTYTSEAKGGSVPDYRSLNEITFLKRAFRFEKRVHRFIAPLDLSTLLEIPYWYHQGKTDTDTIKQNVDTALRELSMHDAQTFNIWSEKILRAARDKMCYFPEVVDRSTLMDIHLSTEEVF